MVQSTLEDHFNEQATKLEQLMTATTLIQNKGDLASELIEAREEVSSLTDGLDLMRTDLDTIKNQNETIKNLSIFLEKLKENIRHMEPNIPPKLLQDYEKIQLEGKDLSGRILNEDTPNGRSSGNEMSDDIFGDDDKENMVKNCRKILFNEPEVCHKIKLISKKEFDLIPKYMIGRQTLSALNNFLDIINQILEAKYSLLALGQNAARKKGELDLYMTFKRQEHNDGKDKDRIYFFTPEDYNRHTETRLDKTKLNFLTVLRHCKRLREIRASKTVHYAVIPSSQY